MAPDLRSAPGPHVFVDDLESPQLLDEDRHHLTRALRLRAGDPLTVSDGAGAWRSARLGASVEPTGTIVRVPAPRYELALGVALTKAAKPEFAVQKATEVGIDHIVVFGSEHSVVKWDAAKRARNAARLERIAREAAMQSRRVRLPRVVVVDDLDGLLELDGLAAPVRADFGGEAVGPDHRFVLVGPEGGWSDAERDRLSAAVDLGPTVLRAETASVVAASLLVTMRGRSD